MRRHFFTGMAVVFALLILAASGVRADAQDFSFRDFSADYYLTRDAQKVSELRVEEKLVATFPDFDQNHGILRAIPESYQNHGLELHVTSVKDDAGVPWHYTASEDHGNLVLKIGDANKYVHGNQTYVIDYTMRGVITDSSQGQEFYWDINGDQWPQAFDGVEARVHVPADLVASLQPPSRCYTGEFGAQVSLCTISYDNDAGGGKVMTVATQPGRTVLANQTLTVEFGFAKGTFAPYTLSAREVQAILLRVAAVAVLPLVTLYILVRNYLRSGRDPKGKGIIVPEYLPPKDVSVLGANTVMKEGYESKASSATIIDLAVRHYLKIYEVEEDGLFKKSDYQIELVKAPDDLRDEERGVLNMLFNGPGVVVGNRVSLSTLKTSLAQESRALGVQVEKQMADAGYFTQAPSKAKGPYYLVAILFGIAGFILFGLGPWSTFIAIGLLIAAGMLGIGALAMPARTAKGVELREYLKGLQEYIKLAEADRLKVLQSPRGDLTEKIDVGDHKQIVKLYEQLLPYAMLFGLEKEWAKVMAPLYDQQPDWYAGNSAFNAAWFASSIGGFNTAAGAAFAPPSSSGSGGGAGGGGGGGW